MLATKIKMRPGCSGSRSLLEIDQIYIEGCNNPGYFKKEVLHDHLKEHPGTIQVNIFPYPDLIHATSSRGEKYVRSAPDNSTSDDLLDLPRE